VFCHKFLEDVQEDSMLFSSQNSWFLYNRPDGPLKASGRPVVSRSFSVPTVQTTELHRPDTRSSYSEFKTELDSDYTIWEGSARRLDDVATRPDATNVLEYFGSPLWMRK
jgi:hypothetical protein